MTVQYIHFIHPKPAFEHLLNLSCSVVDPDPHHFGNLDPDDLHQFLSCGSTTRIHRMSAFQKRFIEKSIKLPLGPDLDLHQTKIRIRIRFRIRVKVISRIRIRIRIRNKVMRIRNTGAVYRWRRGRDVSTPCWIPATPRTTFPSLPVSQVSQTYDFIE